MRKVYTRTFSDEAVAARLPASEPAVTIAAGHFRVVRLKVGSEGRVTRLSVKQVATDVQVDFDITLLMSLIPYPEVNQDLPLPPVPADTVSLYQVCPSMTVAAGSETAAFDKDQTGYPYRNMDGGYTNNQQYLYLLIVPSAAAAETHWQIGITIERDAG